MPARSEGGIPGHVLLGELGRAQGLRGEIRLKSFTADPMAIAGYGPFVTQDGRTIAVLGLRAAAGDQPDMLVARLDGVATREAAEALVRTLLYAPRERLGEAEEDEFFLADLVGLDAVAPDGTAVGRVVGVPDFGGGELLEIAPEGGGPTRLVPFTKAFVPQVDVAGRRVVVDMPDDAGDEEPDGETA